MEPGNSQTFPRVPQLSQQLWFPEDAVSKVTPQIKSHWQCHVCFCMYVNIHYKTQV